MEAPSTALAVLGIIGAAGAATAYFGNARGKANRELLESNIAAYKDSEKLKDARILYLEGQLVVKDETIKRLLDVPKN